MTTRSERAFNTLVETITDVEFVTVSSLIPEISMSVSELESILCYPEEAVKMSVILSIKRSLEESGERTGVIIGAHMTTEDTQSIHCIYEAIDSLTDGVIL